jgi:hypothetical protein
VRTEGHRDSFMGMELGRLVPERVEVWDQLGWYGKLPVKPGGGQWKSAQCLLRLICLLDVNFCL